MKFSNGCWLQREHVGCFSPVQIYDTRIAGDEVILCAPTTWINGKGDTLGGVNLTIRISAPYSEVLRIRTYHHMGLQKREPSFEIAPVEGGHLSVGETAELLIIHSGSLRMEIIKENGQFTFYRGNEKITSSGRNDLAYMKTDWTGLPYDKGPEDAYMRERLTLSVGELIYGMGEHFTPFVRNGQTIEIWNEDGGTSTEQAYKNIPFYLSSRGYGVFVNHLEQVSFEVASESVSAVQFSVAGEQLDYMLINGPTMKEVLMRYTDITGKPSLPAPWTFGLWLSTSFTTDYDEKTVTEFVDGMLERDIPLAVFHFDCCWMKEFHWSDMTWDSRVFPDPKGMLARLKEKGVKICVWINSYIGQESVMFEEGLKGGYFLKRPNGDVWQWDMWQPGMAIVDFTNPAACAWYASKLEALMDMGVDCFKTDFGERIPTDVVYYDGSDPMKMHNYYTYLYNKTVYEIVKKKKGEKEAILFARSATAGCQKFPVHWGGDCWSDYESMEQSLRGGLSLTSSGFGFWSHDIGGFESTSTADVYKRWCAFGLLSTHSRLHGSHSYRVPWLYDEEAVEVVRRFTKLKASLMPYLYRNAVETSLTGVPMMRSMALEYPEDKNCAYLATQYFLGDSLLVAPIFNEKSMAEYYLPEGTWTSFLTGEIREGGKWYREVMDYMTIPLYVKAGSIIAVGDGSHGPVYDYAENVVFKVYALQEGTTAKTCIYNTSAEKVLELEVWHGEQGTYRITLQSDQEAIACSVELVGVKGESLLSFSHTGIYDITVTRQE
ncbi:MAG: alpha-xylosidase [Lachnospiraceae bacterium]|nr:alpha-xylosidase [Lachnospiraceae bacterium]